MTCHNCKITAVKIGKDRKGNQRYRCQNCRKSFQELKDKMLGNMYLPEAKALMCLQLLVEGNSVRSIERITGVHRDTILSLLTVAGAKCEAMMNARLRAVKVTDVQADELWNFVGMKEKTKVRKNKTSNQLGDAYTFVAFERNTKLVITWHLGRRSNTDTQVFIEKLFDAVDGTTNRFQITTDGFGGYPPAIAYSLGTRTDYAQLIKIYGVPEEDDHKYSPSKIKEIIPMPQWGNPNPERICTSHVERQNLNIRMGLRRFTRLTNGFSKKWENLKSAIALYFAYYNFCRIHSSIRCTPAMESGLTGHVWTLRELLAA
jgi:transposase-like protein/IS1 family transposase